MPYETVLEPTGTSFCCSPSGLLVFLRLSELPPLSCAFPREDDDINDVASMAGVNLREENAQILTSMVGSVVQSCQDQLFLAPNLLLTRILHAGRNAAL